MAARAVPPFHERENGIHDQGSHRQCAVRAGCVHFRGFLLLRCGGSSRASEGKGQASTLENWAVTRASEAFKAGLERYRAWMLADEYPETNQ